MDASFGTWIKRRRKALDLTQQDLAERVGCSHSLIVKIESDARRPSREIAKLLVDHLQIPAEQRELFLKVARQEKGVDNLDEAPHLTSPKPASDSKPSRQLNLPVSLTPLLGREHELEIIAQKIDDVNCRLLTLTGPGGVGKTSLALEAGHQLRQSFHDGACFVPLAGADAAEFIIPALADALEFTSSSGRELRSQLVDYLRDKSILLILDNLEHLLDGIEILDEFLSNAPHVKLIATSREKLNLQSEWILEVQGLPVPTHIDAGTLETHSAAALFVQRARQANSRFKPSPENYDAIERICRLVEGLPLGIEIAAAWIRTLTPQEVADEIEQNLDFLTTTARDIPQRHRSIRAVFDYSWNLLTEEERQVMMRLSVFRGGFTREATEPVARATLPILSSLLNKSLIRRGENNRYDIHELVRQFANTRMHEYAQDELSTQDRHCEYFTNLLQKIEPRLKDSEQNEALAILSTELDNLRLAWDWAVNQKKLAELRAAARCVQWFFDLRGWLREGAGMLKRTVDVLEMANDSEKADPEYRSTIASLNIYLGLAHVRSGQVALGRDMLSRNLEFTREHLSSEILADNLAFLGLADHLNGNHNIARTHLEEALAISRSIDYPWIRATSLMILGMVAQTLGDFDEADARLKESLIQWRSIGNPRNIGSCLIIYSSLLNTIKRYDEARAMLRESLAIGRDDKDQWIIAGALLRLSLLASAQEEAGQLHLAEDADGIAQYHELAQAMVEESISLYRELGDRWSLAISLTHLGEIFAARDDRAEARRNFLEALQMTVETQITPETLRALMGLAELCAAEKNFERALELCYAILHNSAASQKMNQRVKKLIAALESQLTSEQVEDIHKRAHTTKLESLAHELINQ